MFRGNPNKDYKKNIQFTGGRINDYSPSSNPNLSAYKTANGTRGVVHNGEAYYDDGNGKFWKSSGRDYLSYDMPKAEEEPKPESPSGGGSSGGSSSGSSSSGYGSTNPYAGNTGSPQLDATTLALMRMVEGLTESLAQSNAITEADMGDVSAPPGAGLNSTVLSQTYLPSSEKKKKSYLTPISVG